MMKVKIFTVTLIVFEGDCPTLRSFIPLWLLFPCYSVYFCIFVRLSSWNFHPKMAATLPKRHLVAVTRKASEFRLLVFYTLWLGGIMVACFFSSNTVESGLLNICVSSSINKDFFILVVYLLLIYPLDERGCVAVLRTLSHNVDILGLITQELKRFGSMWWKVFVVPTI